MLELSVMLERMISKPLVNLGVTARETDPIDFSV